MKTKLSALIILSLLSCSAFGRQHERYDRMPEKIEHTGGSASISISADSFISYNDAMNRASSKKPDGYVIESIKYLRSGAKYIVVLALRKIG